MAASAKQLQSNRANARRSTGPRSVQGKTVVALNACRHGILSPRLALGDENPAEFQTLFDSLVKDLQPVGTVELTLVERIAIALWRQQRLITAETAIIETHRTLAYIVGDVNKAVGNPFEIMTIDGRDLQPLDPKHLAWCGQVLAECQRISDGNPADLATEAPLIHGRLQQDARDEGVPIEQYLQGKGRGLVKYVEELAAYCQQEIQKAEQRKPLLALTEQARLARLLPSNAEVLCRYQTALDNQLYKALKALRETQAWRRDLLEGEVSADFGDAPSAA